MGNDIHLKGVLYRVHGIRKYGCQLSVEGN